MQGEGEDRAERKGAARNARTGGVTSALLWSRVG